MRHHLSFVKTIHEHYSFGLNNVTYSYFTHASKWQVPVRKHTRVQTHMHKHALKGKRIPRRKEYLLSSSIKEFPVSFFMFCDG